MYKYLQKKAPTGFSIEAHRYYKGKTKTTYTFTEKLLIITFVSNAKTAPCISSTSARSCWMGLLVGDQSHNGPVFRKHFRPDEDPEHCEDLKKEVLEHAGDMFEHSD